MTQGARRAVNVGVGVMIKRGDDVLLIRRKNTHGDGTWSTPGGHIDFGEDPKQTAIRETMEETGLRVSEVRFHGITNDVFPEDGKHYITIWMEATYAGGEPVLAAAYEASDIGWFNMNELPSPLFISLKNLMQGRVLGAP